MNRTPWLPLLLSIALLSILSAPFLAGLTAPQQPTEPQLIGRAIVGYRTAAGITTQDSLAKLVRTIAQYNITNRRISEIERGVVAAPDSELIAIVIALDSAFVARGFTAAFELRAFQLIRQGRAIRRQR